MSQINMVKLHIKGNEKEDQFIFLSTCDAEVDDVSNRVIRLWNERLRLNMIASACKEIAKMGPLRTEAERGITDKEIFTQSFPESKLEDCQADPSGQRVGVPPETGAQITQYAEAAIEAISVNRAIQRQALTMEVIEEHRMNLRGCLMIAYPMGLAKHEPLSQFLDEKLKFEWVGDHRKLKDVTTGQLWFASRKLLRTEKLSKYTGTNEKTKVIIKITSEKGGAPVREPNVDEESHKQMLAFWHKKQEKDKELAKDDEDSYLMSEWANPNQLKTAFQGMKDLKIR